MTAQSLPIGSCPVCDYMMDSATDLSNEKVEPQPDDLSVCLKCTSILRFDDELRLVPLAPGEFAKLPDARRATLFRIQRIVRRINRSFSR